MLANTSILVAGAGGLGSLSSMYLAAAGVGRIVIVDDDVVEPSNLNRQILHGEQGLGKDKVLSAAGRLSDLNSGVTVVPVKLRITDDTIDHILDGIDLIMDGTDNYDTRVVLNRAALKIGLSWIFGGVSGFDGMASLFSPKGKPCFECVFPPPGAKEDPGPGIIGPAAGMIASIQSMEAVKEILGIGKGLTGRLLRLSGMDMRINVSTLPPNPECRTCGRQLRKGSRP